MLIKSGGTELEKVCGLPRIHAATQSESTTGSHIQYARPCFSDTLASSGKWGIGLIPRFLQFFYRIICSLLPYNIHKKTYEQVIDDFEASPSRVLFALFHYYSKDDNQAEALLISIARAFKKIGLSDQRELVSKINEIIYKMVFSSDILEIQEKIIMAEAVWNEVERFQEEEKRFNSFLKKVMEKLSENPSLSSIKALFPRDFNWSFGEFIRVLLEKENVQRLKYKDSFFNTLKLVNDTLTHILVIQEGRDILIDQYPKLKTLIYPLRAVLTDPFKEQRLWATVTKLVNVYES